MRPRQDIRLRALVGGAVATTLLVLVETALSVAALDATRREVDEIARSAERSTYLIGDVGRQLSRTRANVLEAATEPVDGRKESLSRADAVLMRLDEATEQLPEALPRPDWEAWEALEPKVETYRVTLSAAIRALEAGDDAGAERLLDGLVANARQVQDDIDAFAILDRRTTDEMLDAAEERERRAMLAVGLLGVGLAVGLAVIWIAVYRMVRRARAELAGYVDRVESANRELDAFAGRVAHDMRNVVSPLPVAAARLRRLDSRDPAKDELADRIERVSTRAARLIDGLLGFARAERGSLAGEGASLRQGITDVLEEHEHLQNSIGAEIEVRVDDVRLAIPPALLHVVLSNLVSNALKHLANRPARMVRIRGAVQDGRCDLRVEDTGTGIPADALGRLFEPFYRVAGTRTAGVGLGLATVRRVVEAHEGSVTIESKEGRGTTVRVLLPVVGSAPRADWPSARQPDANA